MRRVFCFWILAPSTLGANGRNLRKQRSSTCIGLIPWMYRHQNLSGSWTTTIYYILVTIKWYTHAITCIYWHIAATTTWWPSATKQQKKNRKSFDAVKTTCRFPRRLRKRHESSLVVSDVHCASECSLQNAKSAMFESSQDVNTGKVADASLILVFKKGGEQWANK